MKLSNRNVAENCAKLEVLYVPGYQHLCRIKFSFDVRVERVKDLFFDHKIRISSFRGNFLKQLEFVQITKKSAVQDAVQASIKSYTSHFV